MNEFDIGNKVYSIYEPDKIGIVISIDTFYHPYPVYTIKFEDGNEYANYGNVFKLVVQEEDVLRYGEVLTDDELHYELKGHVIICPIHKRIRTISYDNRIFYHKMVNGEVVEFKELTI